jgi:hypothetical protein|tara:strand:+ start:9493 stop:11115 length:1623 start_codon:yes stop_codon:yes gene_type:complete
MSRHFLYDFYSLRDADISNWHDTFRWMVSRGTTTQITLDFVAEQCRLIDQLGHSFESDCLLIGNALSRTFIQVVNHYLSIHRIKERGYELIHSDKLKLIPILNGNKKNRRIEFRDIFQERSKHSSLNIFLKLIRSVEKNIRKGNFSFFDHFDGEKCVYAFSSPNVIDRNYTRRISRWIHITTPDEWIKSDLDASIHPPIEKRLSDVSRMYVDFSKSYLLENFGVLLPQEIMDTMFDFATQYIAHSARVYAVLTKRVQKVKPHHVLTPTAGRSFTRALSLAIRNTGGKVTGFPHGYNICHYSSPRPAFHELATVDEFMAYSPGSVPLFERNLKLNPPPRNNEVLIKHENTDIFLNRWRKWKNKPLASRIETVMVLEISLIPEWAGYHVAEAMVNYHFYYSLCKTLSKNGYKVIFKRRPKSLSWEGINIFNGLKNVEILYNHFEEPGTAELADAFIIQYGGSSTFYWTICTNKTLIYVDAGWESWFPDVYELMKKRCRILHCGYDDRNRTCFDTEELLSLVQTPPEEPNIEFLEKYLFPEEQ